MRGIGIVAHQCRHIESDRNTRLPGFNQKLVALVGFLCRGEPRCKSHRPEPITVPVRMQSARVWILPRPPKVSRRIEILYILGPIDGLEGDIRHRAVGRPTTRPAPRFPYRYSVH